MTPSTLLLIVLISLNLVGIVDLMLKHAALAQRSEKILAFTVLFIFPALIGFMGVSEHLERSKKTEFCLSCHVMEDYGKSLLVDDKEFVPANHFQNNRVPRDIACYTCHTDYTMFGDLNAKIRGLRHLYVQYLRSIPDTIRLYTPYNNRECLSCHEGARSFEESKHHRQDAAMFASIESNTLSCLTSGCHDIIHNVHELNDLEFWNGGSQ